jgi:hypothetical protein
VKLADEIIDALSTEKSSLTEALLKTKILLHKIGHKELVEWVNHELNGYPDPNNLPSYRILPAQVLANAASIAYQFTAHPIPIAHLTPKQRKDLEESRMSQSLAVLEKLVAKDEGHLQAPIPMEFNGLLGQKLVKGVKIQRAWCQISMADVSNIFIQVRSRLLDFLLELNSKLPGELDENELKKRSNAIDASGLFKNAIFGDNTTIVVGSSNTQSVSNTVMKGNFLALADVLRKQNVPENEIQSLELAIQEDDGRNDLKRKRFGPAVKAWMNRMLSEVAGTSWQIELAIAGNILTTALQNYYGWLK